MAYRHGFFPMASDESVGWHSPSVRAVIPIHSYRPSRSLRQVLSKGRFRVSFDSAFEQVIRACASREDTWINDDIIDAYCELHRTGFAHSIETWSEGDLCGGLYGVALGAAFFGESMFHRQPNASKVAFSSLIEHLRQQGFLLLDSQYINEFTASLGAVEVAAATYADLLENALGTDVSF